MTTLGGILERLRNLWRRERIEMLLPESLDYPTDRSKSARRDWIERLQPVWTAAVGAFDERLEYPFWPAPTLEPRHVERCRVVVNRDFMVEKCLPKRGLVAEVGTYRGQFANVILTKAEPRELHLIDVDMSRLERDVLEPALRDGRVLVHEGDSAAKLAGFPDAYFDWIYIDGNHSYDGVRRDIEQAKRKIKRDGLLVFNDYIFWSHAELAEYGVVHAVNELCLEEDWELRYFALETQMYCDVAIARRGDQRGGA